MSKLFDDKEGFNFERELLIGLGESSARKSYYPELQQRIAELEKTQASLLESEMRYRIAIEVSSDAIWDWDIHKDIWSISTAWAKKLGLVPNTTVDFDQPLVVIERLSEKWNCRIHPEDFVRREKKLQEHMEGQNKEVYVIEYRWQVPSGRWIWLLARGKVIFDTKGLPLRMIGSYSDITTRKQQEERIHHMAYHDSLTDLPNAVKLQESLKEYLIGKRDVSGALFLLNVDNFKAVNDTWGYACGDALLVGIAERLVENLAEFGMVVRVGGDEFAFFLRKVEVLSIEKWAQKILGLFSKPIYACRNQIIVSTSVGIVCLAGAVSGDTVLANASTALHHAKKQGKKTWKLFEEEMQLSIIKRLRLENELQQALVLDQLVAFYQPQVHILSGVITGFEALVRWEHPSKGLMPPFDFIPLAEETGLIIPLGELIMRAACRFGNSLKKKAKTKIRVAVNISARQLMQEDFLQRVKKIMREENYSPDALEFEITESILMESLEENIEKIKELRSMGIHISLDDFGTGYSSLRYLSSLPIDILKIDKSFIREIDNTANGAAIIGTIIQLAHQTHIQVVAEGIENKIQLEAMQKLNCDYLQGYLISRPQPSTKILDFYESRQGKFSF